MEFFFWLATILFKSSIIYNLMINIITEVAEKVIDILPYFLTLTKIK